MHADQSSPQASRQERSPAQPPSLRPPLAEAKSIGVLIVDDHAVVRTALRLFLESQAGLTVVGEVARPAEALERARQTHPDVILLDLDLGDANGLDLLPHLRAAAPAAQVLVLTGVRDVDMHRRAVRLGAVGIVRKERAADVLLAAIAKVCAGEVWLDRALIARVLGELTRGGPAPPADPEAAKIAALTAREREVIALVGQGHRNRQVADRLCIAEATVRHHLTSIYAKLHVADRLALTIYAYRHGLAAPRPAIRHRFGACGARRPGGWRSSPRPSAIFRCTIIRSYACSRRRDPACRLPCLSASPG
jgi:two-component system, NarL family, nitrate/nitrite response regulator NarL